MRATDLKRYRMIREISGWGRIYQQRQLPADSVTLPIHWKGLIEAREDFLKSRARNILRASSRVISGPPNLPVDDWCQTTAASESNAEGCGNGKRPSTATRAFRRVNHGIRHFPEKVRSTINSLGQCRRQYIPTCILNYKRHSRHLSLGVKAHRVLTEVSNCRFNNYQVVHKEDGSGIPHSFNMTKGKGSNWRKAEILSCSR